MPEVRQLDVYAEYESLEAPALHLALDQLKKAPESYISGVAEDPPNFANFTDDALPRVLAITRALRKKAASPGSSGARKPRAPKAKASLEDLA